MLALPSALGKDQADSVRALKCCAPFPYREPSDIEKEKQSEFIEFIRSFMPLSANADESQPVETAQRSANT